MSLLSSFREKMVVLLSYHNFNACAVGFTKWNSKKYEMVEKWRCSPPWGCLSLSLLLWLNDNADGFLQGWSPAPNHTRPRTRSATIPLGSNLSARLCRYPSCYSLLSTTAAARSEAEKEVAAAFQVLSDLPGEGSTFRNLNPVASWTLTHLTCEPLPTRTLWHDFLPPSEPSANLASSPGCSTP